MSVPLPYTAVRLPHRVATGAWNMAADFALLEWVGAGPSRIAFRTYGWERPTLSLGRREPFPGAWDAGALERAGIEVARRPTGGNAVLHVEEVTFAVAASIPGSWGLTPRGFAQAVAKALAEALRNCGLPGPTLSKGEHVLEHVQASNALCFARSAPGEVTEKGYKVAGLASRFARTGALCHASVPLTARSRSIARFLRDAESESEALERNARSVGELMQGANEQVLGEALVRAIASGFEVRFSEGAFADVGIAESCEPVSSR